MPKKMREYKGGATRDLDEDKLDFEGYFSPLVLQEFAKYMKRHEQTAQGQRESDNWQSLFGEQHYNVCMKSLLRHVHDLWMEHRGFSSRDGKEEAMMGILFNLQAYALKYYLNKNKLNREV